MTMAKLTLLIILDGSVFMGLGLLVGNLVW
jgi:hypothetical protein